MTVGRSVFALALALAAGAASGQIYRWTDERGKLHFTDTPPPAGAKNVQKQRPASASQGGESEPYALQLARKNAPVTLYSTPSCELCDEARRLLNARGVPFKEISVVTEKQVEELARVVGRNAVPSLVVGSSVHEGFEETTYHGILDAAGYPKTGVVPPRSQPEPKPAATQAEAPAADEGPSGPYAPGARRSKKK